MKVIKQADPLEGYLERRSEIDASLRDVLDKGNYILGERVKKFEAEFSNWLGVPHCVGVANGTDAIEIALRALDIGDGDAVFTVSHTAVATISGIERCGAHPVLVDVDPLTYTMNPESLLEAIKNHKKYRPACVLPVHLYGRPVEIAHIMEIARRYGMAVVEDCAQAHGAECDGRKAGAWGDAAAFSFYPTKNLGTYGDGGAVVTREPHVAERLRKLRQYGWNEFRQSVMAGINSRLDELHAAILLVRLKYLKEDNARRIQIATRYSAGLNKYNYSLPLSQDNRIHVYHQYVIQTDERDALKLFLMNNGITTAIHYPVPVHLQPAYRGQIDIGSSGLANTEKVCKRILSLPVYPQLSDEDVHFVIETMNDWAGSVRKNV
jgi:dTDP-4-amino-4,6-dideoxygalactose transaminase